MVLGSGAHLLLLQRAASSPFASSIPRDQGQGSGFRIRCPCPPGTAAEGCLLSSRPLVPVQPQCLGWSSQEAASPGCLAVPSQHKALTDSCMRPRNLSWVNQPSLILPPSCIVLSHFKNCRLSHSCHPSTTQEREACELKVLYTFVYALLPSGGWENLRQFWFDWSM